MADAPSSLSEACVMSYNQAVKTSTFTLAIKSCGKGHVAVLSLIDAKVNLKISGARTIKVCIILLSTSLSVGMSTMIDDAFSTC